MANWQSTIRIGDLHAKFDRDHDVEACATALAARIKANRFYRETNTLGGIVEDLEVIDDVTEYDGCLRRLYDFGDHGHRIWVDSGKVGE